MTQAKHTPGPWKWRDSSGAGLQISACLPEGFKFDATARGANGKTEFVLWSLRQSQWVEIADERWVQFETGPWEEMQRANARLIAAAPDLLAALEGFLEDKRFVVTVGGNPIAVEIMLSDARAALAKARGED